MGAWPRVKHNHSMGYFTQEDMPFQFALAEAVTICDAARDHREHFLSIKQSAYWYDFTARLVELATYSRRFAGRIETGRHSLSDPCMGGRARGRQEG